MQQWINSCSSFIYANNRVCNNRLTNHLALNIHTRVGNDRLTNPLIINIQSIEYATID